MIYDRYLVMIDIHIGNNTTKTSFSDLVICNANKLQYIQSTVRIVVCGKKYK